MFNHGIREVQELLKDNGCPEAEFNVGYLTAFSVQVRDGVDGTQNDTQDDTQDDTQGDTQGDTLDAWIETQIKKNPKVTTEELASLSNKGVATIKRHLAKLPHIKYVGSGYSGHWEIEK
jgi:ATP-dependent DNA helicase RecG